MQQMLYYDPQFANEQKEKKPQTKTCWSFKGTCTWTQKIILEWEYQPYQALYYSALKTKKLKYCGCTSVQN